jgi:hypothetical protein
MIEKVKAWQKEEAAQRALAGLSDVKAAAAAAKANLEDFLVLSLQVGTDAKLGNHMLDAVSQLHPDASVLLFSSDIDANKTAGFCQVCILYLNVYIYMLYSIVALHMNIYIMRSMYISYSIEIFEGLYPGGPCLSCWIV